MGREMKLSSLFLMTMGFFFLLFVLCDLTATTKSTEIEQINAQIEQLEDEKMGYEAAALRHEDQAERMQFENRMVLETRRHLELAQENREKAAIIQKEIDQLKARKKVILQKLSPPDGFEDI